jgi:hypothetical protein
MQIRIESDYLLEGNTHSLLCSLLEGRSKNFIFSVNRDQIKLISENGYFLSDVTTTSWKIIEQSFVSTVYNL